MVGLTKLRLLRAIRQPLIRDHVGECTELSDFISPAVCTSRAHAVPVTVPSCTVILAGKSTVQGSMKLWTMFVNNVVNLCRRAILFSAVNNFCSDFNQRRIIVTKYRSTPLRIELILSLYGSTGNIYNIFHYSLQLDLAKKTTQHEGKGAFTGTAGTLHARQWLHDV